jgi:hypothetical protein
LITSSLVLFIAFEDIELVGGEPVRSILDRTTVEVERIIDAMEAEAKRLGFVQ